MRYQDKKYDFGSVEILVFPFFVYSVTVARRVAPSLPQRGRQHAGSIPPTPRFSFFLISLMRTIALLADARVAGAQSTMGKRAPQQR